ncbi:hypothetical protein [Neorhizobium sp. P12A]|uniref:hypothetical protein n=1 Tax=Neorhizobium sp. P12A TaxID=2268027 RepID=UPI0011EC8DB1|nr:hypothetical protein [Neorhizobium sp. P12A]
MPYFLVTHTSLVEADDAAAAAKTVVRNLRDGKDIAFTVKFDDENVRQVVVSARDLDLAEARFDRTVPESGMPGAETFEGKPIDNETHFTPVGRTVGLSAMLCGAVGLIALGILVGLACSFA